MRDKIYNQLNIKKGLLLFSRAGLLFMYVFTEILFVHFSFDCIELVTHVQVIIDTT